MGWFESAKSWVGERARDVEVAAQGVTRGLASGVAGVGDLAVGVGYNWTVRHLTGGEKVETNFADKAANAVTWTEARNNRERAIMAGGQVVGEIAGFVAVTVATGGVGGAAVGGSLAVMRGATAARAVAGAATATRTATIATEAATTATRAASATARMMNPLASKVALAVEGGFGVTRGIGLYREDQAATAMADTVRTEMAQGVIDTAVLEQTALSNSAERVRQNLDSVLTELNDPALTAERHAQLMTQLDQIDAHNAIIQNLQNSDLSAEQRAALWEDLKAVDPAVQAELDGRAVAETEPAAEDRAEDAGPAATREDAALNNSALRVRQELDVIIEEMSNPDLPAARHAELMSRLDVLDAHNSNIQKMQNEDLPAEQRNVLWQDLKAADPAIQADLNANAPSAPASALNNNFQGAAANAQPPAIDEGRAAEPEQKPVYKAPALTAPAV